MKSITSADKGERRGMRCGLHTGDGDWRAKAVDKENEIRERDGGCVHADDGGRTQRAGDEVEEDEDGAKMATLSRRLRAPRRLTTVERSPIFPSLTFVSYNRPAHYRHPPTDYLHAVPPSTFAVNEPSAIFSLCTFEPPPI